MKQYEWVFYTAYMGKRYSIPEQIKEKIEAASPDELYIVAAKANTPGFVINRNKLVLILYRLLMKVTFWQQRI